MSGRNLGVYICKKWSVQANARTSASQCGETRSKSLALIQVEAFSILLCMAEDFCLAIVFSCRCAVSNRGIDDNVGQQRLNVHSQQTFNRASSLSGWNLLSTKACHRQSIFLAKNDNNADKMTLVRIIPSLTICSLPACPSVCPPVRPSGRQASRTRVFRYMSKRPIRSKG